MPFARDMHGPWKTEQTCQERKRHYEQKTPLQLEIAVLMQRLQDANEQYEYLLGKYQVDVGNKIIHF